MTSWLDALQLPREITTFEHSYLNRMNRIALGFFWLNLPLFVAVAFFNDTQPGLAVVLTVLTLLGPSFALYTLDNPRTVSLVHGFTAMCMGGLLVHFGQGPVQIEMHFYFFSLLAVLAMFGNPMVIVVAAVTVTLHHTVVWAIIPRSVFNYDASLWVVGIHASFVVVESVAACFIARSFFDNVIGLEKLVQARTAALAQRNEDLRLVLDNVHQGFVTVSRDGSLATERSGVLDAWLEPGAMTLQALVAPAGGTFAEALQIAWEVLTDGFMPTEVALDQLPKRLVTDDRTLGFTYQVIDENEEGIQSLLVIVSDITAQEANELAEARQRELTAVIGGFLADKVGFLEFYADADRLVEWIVTESYGDDLVLAKRWLHTLKGNAAIFGLDHFSKQVHAVEDVVIETGASPSRKVLDGLRARWSELCSQLNELMGEQTDGVELSPSEYQRLIEAVEAEENRERLRGLVHALALEPVNLRLRRMQEQARGIASRLDKSQVDIEVQVDDVRLNSKRFQGFWSSFGHVLRNALDHGIETATERSSSGKAGHGRLVLSAQVEDETFVVTASDDGRGIDWERVQVRANELGLPIESPEERAQVLFHDGFTTRRTATLVSGRGVGLGAVRQAVEELGGAIEVRSEANRGTEFRFTFPLQELQDAVWVDAPDREPALV